jgi:hypothetical protein
MKITKIIFALILSLNFACMVDRPYDTPPDESQYQVNHLSFSNSTHEYVDITGGILMGDIGPIKNIDNPTAIGGFHDDEFTSVEVAMTNSQGSAMVLLSFYGGIIHEDLVPGSVHQFIPTTLERDDFSVEAIVCSGMGVYGDWDYDDISNMVQVDVEETNNPDINRLNFTTYTEDDVAIGHIDVATEGDIG